MKKHSKLIAGGAIAVAGAALGLCLLTAAPAQAAGTAYDADSTVDANYAAQAAMSTAGTWCDIHGEHCDDTGADCRLQNDGTCPVHGSSRLSKGTFRSAMGTTAGSGVRAARAACGAHYVDEDGDGVCDNHGSAACAGAHGARTGQQGHDAHTGQPSHAHRGQHHRGAC